MLAERPLGRDDATQHPSPPAALPTAMPEPVTERVWRVDLGRVNAYLVDTDEGPVAVDAGMPGDHDEMCEAMRQVELDPDALRRVLVTHTDLDHVGGLASLVEGTDATIHVSRAAAEILTGERKPPWLSTKGLFQRLTSPWLDPPSPGRLETVEDEDEIDRFVALSTPGHALGHLAFVHVDERVCFIGDLIRAEGEIAFPPGVINYDGDELRASLRHLLDRAPGFDVVCAGHGEPVRQDAYGTLKRLLG